MSRRVRWAGKGIVGDLRYADAGVDIDAGNRAVGLIRQAVTATHGPAVIGGLGNFGGLFALDTQRWQHPVLVSSTDSVGTKLKIAIATGRHRGIGEDLVNHCINDILCCGAEPLFFLDYYATGRLQPEHLAQLIEGAAAACSDAGCALIGGETAELPGLYALGDYDIAGFIVGVVDRAELVDGSRVRPGDAVLALPSSGLHTNGYSLVRHVVAARELEWDVVLPGTERSLADLLLEPHRCYLRAMRELRRQVEVRAISHITGGGLIENIPRVLPEGLGVILERDAWDVPSLYSALQRVGGIHPDEMWRTFNMGLGMIVVVPAEQADRARSVAGLPVLQVGRVVHSNGPQRVVLR